MSGWDWVLAAKNSLIRTWACSVAVIKLSIPTKNNCIREFYVTRLI